MIETFTILISLAALAVSIVTAWLTLFRRGQIRMTQPTVVFFGPDGPPREDAKPQAKVFLRTLLYSTGRRGQVLESMWVNLRRGESNQNFSIWVYGDKQLLRGSGLFVGPEGLPTNHHFLLPLDGAEFRFFPGSYTLRVYGKCVGSASGAELCKLVLSVSDEHGKELKNDTEAGIYFDWGPDLGAYHAHVETRPPQPQLPPWLRLPASE